MSKQASPTVIGVFVVGAVALVVAGVLLFGSGHFLEEKLTYVLYFDSSLKGLSVGAPVQFRGVRVGTVSDINVVIDASQEDIRIPVFMELEEGTVHVVNVGPDTVQEEIDEEKDRQFIQKMIEGRGLRAQLQMQSLVTGQLFVQLDFYPDTPIKLHTGFNDPYPEFPTIASPFEQLTQKLEDLPLEDLANAAVQAIQGIDRLVRGPELRDALQALDESMKNIQLLTKKIDARFTPLADGLENTFEAARSALEQAERTLAMEEGAPARLAAGLQETFDAARAAMDQAQVMLSLEEGAAGRVVTSIEDTAKAAQVTLAEANKTFSMVEDVAAPGTPLRYNLNNTLEELSAAARSIRVLAEYLERHPEALVRGKGGSER